MFYYKDRLNVEGIGNIIISRKPNIKNISIKIDSKGGITLNLPYFISNSEGIEVLREHLPKLLSKIEKRKKNIGAKNTAKLPVEREELMKVCDIALKTLSQEIRALSLKHNLHFNRLTLKNNKTNWGSCSSKKNINLNIRLILLPKHLREFVMLHELTHLIHDTATPEIHTYLNSLCNGEEKALSQELRTWKIC